MKKMTDLTKMNDLLAKKGETVIPASDAVQRGGIQNSSKDEIVNLSFKVPAEFRKKFKLAAIEAGITQNELVQRTLLLWVNSNK